MDTHAPDWPGHLAMHIENPPDDLLDRVQDLLVLAERFRALRLAPEASEQLAGMVRLMNTYYSNKIEGNPTKVIDLEALHARAATPEQKDYGARAEVEARALDQVHALFDRAGRDQGLAALGLEGRRFPVSSQALSYFHAQFFNDFPDDLLWLSIDGSDATVKIRPGQFRDATAPLRVGRHHPPTGDQVPAFMAHFEAAYTLDKMPKSKAVRALAAAHHRLAYIHPFWDGNGRVARLMSHAFAQQIGLGADGLWSLSRGLARGLAKELERGIGGGDEAGQQYKAKLAWADQKPMRATDGRGATSEQALIDFSNWFFDVCLDQMRFMLGLFDFETLRERLGLYVARAGLRGESLKVLKEVHARGAIARGEVQHILRVSPRTASQVIAELERDGILGSPTARGPISLRFPVKTHDALFPGLH